MKQKHAVALQYRSAEELPTVLSHGVGTMAEQLLALAKRLEIPILENTELSSLLKSVAPGKPISPRAEKLVAHVISFLYFCDEKFKREHPFLEKTLNHDGVK